MILDNYRIYSGSAHKHNLRSGPYNRSESSDYHMIESTFKVEILYFFLCIYPTFNSYLDQQIKHRFSKVKIKHILSNIRSTIYPIKSTMKLVSFLQKSSYIDFPMFKYYTFDQQIGLNSSKSHLDHHNNIGPDISKAYNKAFEMDGQKIDNCNILRIFMRHVQ